MESFVTTSEALARSPHGRWFTDTTSRRDSGGLLAEARVVEQPRCARTARNDDRWGGGR